MVGSGRGWGLITFPDSGATMGEVSMYRPHSHCAHLYGRPYSDDGMRRPVGDARAWRWLDVRGVYMPVSAGNRFTSSDLSTASAVTTSSSGRYWNMMLTEDAWSGSLRTRTRTACGAGANSSAVVKARGAFAAADPDPDPEAGGDGAGLPSADRCRLCTRSEVLEDGLEPAVLATPSTEGTTSTLTEWPGMDRRAQGSQPSVRKQAYQLALPPPPPTITTITVTAPVASDKASTWQYRTYSGAGSSRALRCLATFLDSCSEMYF